MNTDATGAAQQQSIRLLTKGRLTTLLDLIRQQLEAGWIAPPWLVGWKTTWCCNFCYPVAS